MQTKFKRHQKIKLLADPDPEYVEYYSDKKPQIKKGMIGKINILLPNGEYHIKIIDKKGKTIAYIKMSEEFLESID